MERLKQVGKLTADLLRHALILGAFAAVCFVGLKRLTVAGEDGIPAGSSLEIYPRWVSGLHRLKVRDAVETYLWEKGSLPQDVEDVVHEGLLHSAEARFPWGEPYLYETYDSGTEHGFFLFNPVR